MKAVVFTLGCKVNSCESSSLMNGLETLGYEVSDKLSYADIYVINTCAVTKEAEKKSRQAVSRVRKFNSNAKVYVLGCATQNHPEDFLKIQGVTLIMGTASKDKLLSLLDQTGKHIEEGTEYYEEYLPIKAIKSRSYVKIQDGCENFCSYCLIPYLRGKSRSRSVESIISELNYLDPLEVVLTGINLSSYNYNGINLTGLLDRLKDFNFRIRLGSLEVGVISDEFLTACKNLKDFAATQKNLNVIMLDDCLVSGDSARKVFESIVGKNGCPNVNNVDLYLLTAFDEGLAKLPKELKVKYAGELKHKLRNSSYFLY